jgi:alpha-L-rhamnosidase
MTEYPLPKHIWWPWNEPAERVGFSRNFFNDTRSSARLSIACSGSYRVWLDGIPLKIPISHMPSWRSMHILPIELAPGRHVICFVADRVQQQQPFLMACLDWKEGSETRRIATDEDWDMIREPEEHAMEDFLAGDPTKMPFRKTWAFDGVWAEPWGMPCNAPDDFCRLSTGWQSFSTEPLTTVVRLFPGAEKLGSAIERFSDGSLKACPPLPYPVSIPALEMARPRLEWYRTREAHSIINNTWLEMFENRCPHGVFDAGVETFARLRLTLRSGGPCILAISTGESLNEVYRYARRVTDIIQLTDGESFTTAPTGFRFVKVMILSAGSDAVQLEPVQMQHIRYPVQPYGSFRCSDPDLNAIFDLSARTLHLCMQNEIWDAIKRDQLPWMGDLYTEALAAYLLFGDYRLARRSLAVLSEIGPGPSLPLDQQRYAGLQAIWKTAGGDINDIPSYTLWWLVGLWDYYQYSGDLTLIGELRSEIHATLRHIASWVNAEGIWHLQSGWDFVDWAPLSVEDRAIYSHLLACRVLDQGTDLLEAIGESAIELRDLQRRMVGASRKAWWQGGAPAGFGTSHHANAQAICSGILEPEEAGRVFEQSLQGDPPLSMTYWHRYLDLEAARKVGQVRWGLGYIRRHWGMALQVGMTTLWEAFDPDWMGEDPHGVSMIGAGYARYGGYETSLCHGWSSGPAVWLMTAVLGVTPAAPGFTKVSYCPDLGDLEWAEGDIPTPRGLIHVRLRRNPDGSLDSNIRVPEGLEILAGQ